MPAPALDDRLRDMESEAIDFADSIEGKGESDKLWAIYREWHDLNDRSNMWNMSDPARKMMLETWGTVFFQRLHENSQ